MRLNLRIRSFISFLLLFVMVWTCLWNYCPTEATVASIDVDDNDDNYDENDYDNEYDNYHGGVIELTSKDFDTSIKNGSIWLVEFHAPWCRHCRDFAESYEKIAQELHHDENVDVKVAKVDAESERAIRSRFGIVAFPTFYLIDGWYIYELPSQDRSPQKIVDFCRGGYKHHAALPVLTSPFGPMGLLQGWIMQIGVHVLSTYDYWTNDRGISPIILLCAMAIGGLTCGIFFMIALTVALSSKPKDE